MYFDFELLPPILLAIIGCALLSFFFWYYGAFKLPLTTSLPLLFTIYIAVFQTFTLVPYDVSLTLFGASENHAEKLGLTLEIVYWISWVMGWIITPVLTCIYTYNYGLTFGRRLWYAIRYNLIWYAVAGAIAVVGIIVLYATNMLTFANLKPLVMSLSNAYGLLLICLLFGYGFVALPKNMWHLASREKELNMHLFNINREASDVAQAIVDVRALRTAAINGKDQVIFQLKSIFSENIDKRVELIDQLLSETKLKTDRYFAGLTPSKNVKKAIEIKWRSAAQPELEIFLFVMDKSTNALKCSGAFFLNSAEKAKKIIEKNGNKKSSTSELVLKRILSIFIALICAVAFWGEMTIMFDNRLSIFYILSHLKVPWWVGELFITFPILLIQTLVASWALTKVKLGNYFRFIKGGSSDTTFYYMVIVLGRVAPTIGYHYLKQIGGEDSQTLKVWFKSQDVFFFGNYWPVYSPCLIALIGICVIFNVWGKILSFFGCKNFALDEQASLENEVECSRGNEALLDLYPSLNCVTRESLEKPLYIDTPLSVW